MVNSITSVNTDMTNKFKSADSIDKFIGEVSVLCKVGGFLLNDMQSVISKFGTLESNDINISFDKIDIKSSGVSDKWIKGHLKFCKPIYESYYGKGSIYSYKKNEGCIKILNRGKKYKIEINPTVFNSLKDLNKLTEKIVGKKWFGTHRISRLDISITMPSKLICPRSFFYSMNVDKLHTSDKYYNVHKRYKMNDIVTFDIGKNPRRNTVYDREFKFDVLASKTIKKKKSDKVVNFEIQLSDAKIIEALGGDKISFLENLYKYDILRDIYFNDPTSLTKCINMNENVMEFISLVYCHGFQVARANYNKKNGGQFNNRFKNNFSEVVIKNGNSFKSTVQDKFISFCNDFNL